MFSKCKNPKCNKLFLKKDVRKIFCENKCAKYYGLNFKCMKKIVTCKVCKNKFKQINQSQVSCSSICSKKYYLIVNKKKRSETQRKFNKIYKQKNKKLYAYHQNNRRALKMQATPKYANIDAIKKFYKDCPKNKTVDHIYPLKSNWVCGLNIIDNLQYLTRSENSIKSNRRMLKYHD